MLIDKKEGLSALLSTFLLTILLTLASCEAGDGQKVEGRKEIVLASRLWSTPRERQIIIDSVLGPFEKENGVRVHLQTVDEEELLSATIGEDGEGDAGFDVLISYISMVERWRGTELFLDLEPRQKLWEGRSFMDIRSTVKRYRREEAEGTYFLPLAMDSYLLCVNKKALPYLPKGYDIDDLTWSELGHWLKVIAAARGEGKFGFSAATQSMLIYQLGGIILSYGGGFPDISSPAALDAWEALLSFRDGISPRISDYESMVAPMVEGKEWISLVHNARAGAIYQSNPEQFILSPPPKGPAGRGAIVGMSLVGVRKDAQNIDLAVALVEYMTQPAINLHINLGIGGFVPPIREAFDLLEAQKQPAIEHSMRVLSEGVLDYIPPDFSEWATVKLIVERAFFKILFEDGYVNKEYLGEAQKKIEDFRKKR